MYELSENYAVMRENIVKHSRDYLVKQGMKCLVVGMSGGIDSTIVAALMSETSVPVIGVTIPLEGNKPDEVRRSLSAANALCKIHMPIDMNGLVKLIEDFSVFDEDNEHCSPEVMKIRKGNIKARARMIQLFDIARAHNGLVLSTDNYTEYLLGFWTLHGDVGNFGPIQQIWKTEVYGLSEFLRDEYRSKGKISQADSLDDCINAIPTDGLGITKSDFDQIIPGQDETKSPKERYREVDDLLIKYLQVDKTLTKKLVDHPVIQRHIASQFKRRDPVNLGRDLLI